MKFKNWKHLFHFISIFFLLNIAFLMVVTPSLQANPKTTFIPDYYTPASGEPSFYFYEDGNGQVREGSMAEPKGNDFSWKQQGNKITLTFRKGQYSPRYDIIEETGIMFFDLEPLYKPGSQMTFTIRNSKTLSGPMGTLTQK